jgi:hypothetical protein
MASESIDLVIRATEWRRSSPGGLIVASVWIVASAFFLLRLHGALLVVLAVVDAVLVALAVVLFNRSYQRTRLTLVGGRLVFSGLYRDRVVSSSGSPGRVVRLCLIGLLDGGPDYGSSSTPTAAQTLV